MVNFAAMPNDFLEGVQLINDEASGVVGVIAIHSTSLGPAAGGCRVWHYESHSAMVDDALRLARGMSYKNAMAGLPFGGGKAVLQRPASEGERERLFHLFGEAVEALGGSYITAEDVGTSLADMKLVRRHTSYVAGLDQRPGRAGGDPSPWTALGVFESLKAALRISHGTDLKGLRVAVQGAGNVGSRLAHLLHAAGAKLVVADVDQDKAQRLAAHLGADLAHPRAIVEADVDIFAPCALGSILNADSIPSIKARLICGGANNQLATPEDGQRLVDRNIVYAPDYVVNAGGIINVALEYLGEPADRVEERVRHIADRVTLILEQARRENMSASAIADAQAQSIIDSARTKAA
jgi:leucine dehydrogenase